MDSVDYIKSLADDEVKIYIPGSSSDTCTGEYPTVPENDDVKIYSLKNTNSSESC